MTEVLEEYGALRAVECGLDKAARDAEMAKMQVENQAPALDSGRLHTHAVALLTTATDG